MDHGYHNTISTVQRFDLCNEWVLPATAIQQTKEAPLADWSIEWM